MTDPTAHSPSIRAVLYLRHRASPDTVQRLRELAERVRRLEADGIAEAAVETWSCVTPAVEELGDSGPSVSLTVKAFRTWASDEGYALEPGSIDARSLRYPAPDRPSGFGSRSPVWPSTRARNSVVLLRARTASGRTPSNSVSPRSKLASPNRSRSTTVSTRHARTRRRTIPSHTVRIGDWCLSLGSESQIRIVTRLRCRFVTAEPSGWSRWPVQAPHALSG